MPKIVLDWKTTHDFMKDAFIGVGVPADDAEIVVDVLLESDRRGIESHGCNRFKPVTSTESTPASRAPLPTLTL